MPSTADPPPTSHPSHHLTYTPSRLSDLTSSYSAIHSLVRTAASRASLPTPTPTSHPRPSPEPLLLAISKLKPASDVAALYDSGVRDFGENYVQELVDKAEALKDREGIRWHFVGGLQSNKCKVLAAVPNLHAVHTIDSAKKADLLEKALSASSSSSSSSPPPQLNVYIQINTSSESSKSGLPPPFTAHSFSPSPTPSPSPSPTPTVPTFDNSTSNSNPDPSSTSPTSPTSPAGSTSSLDLATHIACSCPHLRLIGLMCIGALEGDPTADFETLRKARERTEKHLRAMNVGRDKVGLRPASTSTTTDGEGGGGEGQGGGGPWLELSMGMSGDFEKAIEMGSGVVRVGTSIFGERPKKATKERS